MTCRIAFMLAKPQADCIDSKLASPMDTSPQYASIYRKKPLQK